MTSPRFRQFQVAPSPGLVRLKADGRWLLFCGRLQRIALVRDAGGYIPGTFPMGKSCIGYSPIRNPRRPTWAWIEGDHYGTKRDSAD
jgi:hypothetical protein